MLYLNRLQLLGLAYCVLLSVGCYEYIKDVTITHNLLQSSLNQYTNPVQLAMLPFAFVIGLLIAKELDV